MKEIKLKILTIVNENIENNKITIEQLDVDLSKLAMDSIALIHIVVALEEEFNIEIPNEYLLVTKMNTINKMAAIVEIELGRG